MTSIKNRPGRKLVGAVSLALGLFAGSSVTQLAQAATGHSLDADKARVIEHWTKDRMQHAIPRDLVIDPRGLGYLRKPDGSLEPYGHQIAADTILPNAKPAAEPSGSSGSSDSTPSTISNMDPAAGSEIGSSYTFSATVTDDASGVKSVSFVIQYPDGVTSQSFNANQGSNDTWQVTLQGFSNGSWAWWVVAKDGAKRGGNTATSPVVAFTVNTGGSGAGSGTDTVTSAVWTGGGVVQTATGRLYFEMPSNTKWKGPWTGYVCSGSVVVDSATGRSVILTAAHCVYDDANKAFARNVLFIPDQAETSGSGTDLNCNNDPLGCWVPSFGVVDNNWTTTTFPNNKAWDYAYYVVSDSGAHAGAAASSDSLDAAVGALSMSFVTPYTDDGVDGAGSIDFTHALGYSYDEDPNFMYCADDMTINGSVDWWLPSCALSGGASGGPWIQPMDTSVGKGPVISVNSWGYSSAPGMAGAMLSGTSAECVFVSATGTDWGSAPTANGEEGVKADCP